MAGKKVSIIFAAKDMASKVFKGIRSGLSSVGDLAKKIFSPGGLLLGGVGGFGLGMLGKSFLETASSIEDLELSLSTTLGTMEKARAAIAYANKEAAASPFTMLEYAESIKTLSAYGIDYTKTMTTLGNTAAAMGKPLQQAVEALSDALQGEGERLKEFGIKQRVAGDQITYTWVDNLGKVRESIAQNNPAIIQEVLLGIWNEKYKGGMAKFADAWSGLTSTLKSQWESYKNKVMQSGPFEILKSKLKDLTAYLGREGNIDLWATKTALTVVKGFQQIMRVTGGASEVIIGFGRAFQFVYGNAIKIVGGLAAKVGGNAEKQLAKAREVLANTPQGSPLYDINRQTVERLEQTALEAKALADASVDIVEKTEASGRKLAELQGSIAAGANKAADALQTQVDDLERQKAEFTAIVEQVGDRIAQEKELAAVHTESVNQQISDVDRYIAKLKEAKAAKRELANLDFRGSNHGGSLGRLEDSIVQAERTGG